jgi:hypothetical protein
MEKFLISLYKPQTLIEKILKFLSNANTISIFLEFKYLSIVLFLASFLPLFLIDCLQLNPIFNEVSLYLLYLLFLPLLMDGLLKLSIQKNTKNIRNKKNNLKNKILTYLKNDETLENKDYLMKIKLIAILERLEAKIKNHPKNYAIYLNQLDELSKPDEHLDDIINIVMNNPTIFLDKYQHLLEKSSQELKNMCEKVILQTINTQEQNNLKKEFDYFTKEKNSILFKKKNLTQLHL